MGYFCYKLDNLGVKTVIKEIYKSTGTSTDNFDINSPFKLQYPNIAQSFNFLAISVSYGSRSNTFSTNTILMETTMMLNHWSYMNDYYNDNLTDGIMYGCYSNHLEIRGYGNATPAGKVHQVVGIKLQI